jgi:hypothetical protein
MCALRFVGASILTGGCREFARFWPNFADSHSPSQLQATDGSGWRYFQTQQPRALSSKNGCEQVGGSLYPELMQGATRLVAGVLPVGVKFAAGWLPSLFPAVCKRA